MFLVTLQTVLTNQSVCSYGHRLLLLKLDKQIGGTIYWPILAANKACHMEGVGCPVGGCGYQIGGGGCHVGGGEVPRWRGWVQ